MHSYLQAWHTKQYILNIFFSHIVGFARSTPECNSHPSVVGVMTSLTYVARGSWSATVIC